MHYGPETMRKSDNYFHTGGGPKQCTKGQRRWESLRVIITTEESKEMHYGAETIRKSDDYYYNGGGPKQCNMGQRQ